jgi:hypothetical protein
LEISCGAVITCSSGSVWCKWSMNPITNSNPVYSHNPNTWPYIIYIWA